MITQNRINLIRQAVLKVQCLPVTGTKPATKKADRKLIKLVDSVLASEYCTKDSASSDRVELLDFND